MMRWVDKIFALLVLATLGCSCPGETESLIVDSEGIYTIHIDRFESAFWMSEQVNGLAEGVCPKQYSLRELQVEEREGCASTTIESVTVKVICDDTTEDEGE